MKSYYDDNSECRVYICPHCNYTYHEYFDYNKQLRNNEEPITQTVNSEVINKKSDEVLDGSVVKTAVKLARIPYTQWKSCEKILIDGSIVFVINIPWYRSWFGLKPTRIILGDGITPCNKLRWI